MTTIELPPRSAWEPLTPRGVAAFAGASLGRLLLAQFLVALLVAACLGWFVERGWFPVVHEAIEQLPETGEMANGQLAWNGNSPQLLAQNRFLGIGVDLFHSGELEHDSHLQIELGQQDFRLHYFVDYAVFDYPPEWNFAFNRTKLDPWWGAWHPWLLIVALAGVVAGLMISWSLFATIYCVPVRVLSFLENRDLNWRQSWLLSGAAMMPGALFLAAAIVGYALGWMDLLRLCAMYGLHFVVGWIYLVISPFFCPRSSAIKKPKDNPFTAPK